MDDEVADFPNHLIGYGYAQQPVAPSKLGHGDSGGSYYPAGGTGGGYPYSSPGVPQGSGSHPGYPYSGGVQSGYGGGYGSTGVSDYTGGGKYCSARAGNTVIKYKIPTTLFYQCY